MKSDMSKFLTYFYTNYRYIPLLGLLIGMKLCIITMILDTRTELSNNLKMPTKGNFWKNFQRSVPFKAKLKVVTEGDSNIDIPIPPEVLREWKTLANLTNSSIGTSSKNRTDPESIWLIFNRVPASGDEEMVELLNRLSQLNKFDHQTHEYRTPWKRFLVEEEQENLVRWFEYQHLPKSYDRHFYFVNFTFYQSYIKERPIYINLVKDPVTRLKSSFQAKRSDPKNRKKEIRRRDEQIPGSGLHWLQKNFEDCVLSSDPECAYENGTEEFTLSVPFFCGQHPKCVLINDKWAVQRAKFTIEKYYSVVGVYENLGQSLIAFEKYIPRFFQGASELYKGILDQKRNLGNTNNRRQLERVQSLLEKKLPAEFEIYRFINERLRTQIAFLQNRNTETTPAV